MSPRLPAREVRSKFAETRRLAVLSRGLPNDAPVQRLRLGGLPCVANKLILIHQFSSEECPKPQGPASRAASSRRSIQGHQGFVPGRHQGPVPGRHLDATPGIHICIRLNWTRVHESLRAFCQGPWIHACDNSRAHCKLLRPLQSTSRVPFAAWELVLK